MLHNRKNWIFLASCCFCLKSYIFAVENYSRKTLFNVHGYLLIAMNLKKKSLFSNFFTILRISKCLANSQQLLRSQKVNHHHHAQQYQVESTQNYSNCPYKQHTSSNLRSENECKKLIEERRRERTMSEREDIKKKKTSSSERRVQGTFKDK